MSDAPHLVDARGLLCPWPVLRVSRAARALGGTGALKVLADDPAAAGELEQLCRERGWHLRPDPAQLGAFAIILR